MASLAAGYGESLITPPLGIGMTGYGCYLDRNAESVLDDLKARALALAEGEERLILVSCDLLGLTVEFSDAVRQEIADAHGIARGRVLLACTHTHSGPASQHLRGMPEPEPEYLAHLRRAIPEAAAAAVSDQRPAEFSYFLETVEPIGFNRRNRSFEPIDPVLKVACFQHGNDRIYLMNYSCHAVTLGINKQISADWPGALVRTIEADGHRGIVFQGFLGDINPTANGLSGLKQREGFLPYYGRMLYERARLAESLAVLPPEVRLRAVERRVDLPLAVPSEEELERDWQAWRPRWGENSGFIRTMDEWYALARENLAAYAAKAYIPNLPLQALAIGDLYVIGFPGETFCEYGLRLRAKFPNLMNFGQCNGNVGYLPTREAFATEFDYACYLAPKLYALYSFRPEIEDLLLEEAEGLLADLSKQG